jgi:hypothetical protein
VLPASEHRRCGRDKKARRQRQCERAFEALEQFLEQHAAVAK